MQTAWIGFRWYRSLPDRGNPGQVCRVRMRSFTELDHQIAAIATAMPQEPAVAESILLGPVNRAPPRRPGLPVRICDPQPPTGRTQALEEFLGLDSNRSRPDRGARRPASRPSCRCPVACSRVAAVG